MTDDEVGRVVLVLITGFTSFSDGLANTYDEKLRGLTNPEIALKTANHLVDHFEGFSGPPWATFRNQYTRFYERWEEQEREKQLAIDSGGRLAGTIPPSEGRHIAAAAYAKQFKRRPPADIFALPDPEALPKVTQEEVDKALRVIAGGYDHDGKTYSNYSEVLKAFDGHQGTARAAVAALEGSKRVHHHPNGVLILLPA